MRLEDIANTPIDPWTMGIMLVVVIIQVNFIISKVRDLLRGHVNPPAARVPPPPPEVKQVPPVEKPSEDLSKKVSRFDIMSRDDW